ncbi:MULTISPECIES: transposase [Bacillus]|uniref:transposase n=1 Tax=Bacillus TaxID=1386 RepID=UPI00224932FA|nr:transposase [Bacillus sp. ChL18]MCX2811203.1 transposase [Bacillus sp. ChL18]
MEGIFYGETCKTYDIHFKKKVVDLHLNDGMSYQTIARERNIDKNLVRKWVNYFQTEGMKGSKQLKAVQEAVCKYIHFYQSSTIPKEVKQPEPISIQDSGCFVSF